MATHTITAQDFIDYQSSVVLASVYIPGASDIRIARCRKRLTMVTKFIGYGTDTIVRFEVRDYTLPEGEEIVMIAFNFQTAIDCYNNI